MIVYIFVVNQHGLVMRRAGGPREHERGHEQVEVQMFTATGWELIEPSTPGAAPAVRPPSGGGALRILRRFEFDHARMTMAVVVAGDSSVFNGGDGGDDHGGDVGAPRAFVKGAYEKMGELCDPATLPSDYLAVARAHALDGCYVLALAHRPLTPKELELELAAPAPPAPSGGEGGVGGGRKEAAAAAAIAALSRDEVEGREASGPEGQLRFLGLVLFRNELKPDTRSAILDLKVL